MGNRWFHKSSSDVDLGSRNMLVNDVLIGWGSFGGEGMNSFVCKIELNGVLFVLFLITLVQID